MTDNRTAAAPKYSWLTILLSSASRPILTSVNTTRRFLEIRGAGK